MISRTNWGRLHLFCWVCGVTSNLQNHDIARGCHRASGARNPANWVRCCFECHDRLGDYGQWPVVRQLALKMSRDAAYYNLAAVNVLRGRQAFAIAQDEVDAALATIEPVPVYLVDAFR